MKITRVRAVHYQAHNVMTGWKVSLGGRDIYDLVFVRIDADNGSHGLGLASPGALYITGDTAAHHLHLINDRFGPAIVGADPFDIESIMRKLDRVAMNAEAVKSGSSRSKQQTSPGWPWSEDQSRPASWRTKASIPSTTQCGLSMLKPLT